MEGELTGGELDGSAGEVVSVDETAVVDVDEEVVVGKEVSTDEGEGDVCDHEFPGVGFVSDGDGHLLNAIRLDGGTVGSDKADVRTLAEFGGQGLRQEGTASTSINQVTDVGPAVCEKKDVGGGNSRDNMVRRLMS